MIAAALLMLRRVPREVWYALGAAALVYAAYGWAWDRGADATAAKLQPQIDQAKLNQRVLEDAVTIQNEAIEALRANEARARQAVQKAAQAGERARGRIAPHIEGVRAVEASGQPVPDAVKKLWGAL